jgi:hypothetical protein
MFRGGRIMGVRQRSPYEPAALPDVSRTLEARRRLQQAPVAGM